MSQIHEVTEEHTKTVALPQHSTKSVNAVEAKFMRTQQQETKMKEMSSGSLITVTTVEAATLPRKADAPLLASNVMHAKN